MAAETNDSAATADAPPPEPKEAKDAPDDAATPPKAESPTKEDASRALMDAVNVALSFKELGNARFKAGDNKGAVEEYEKGLETLKKASNKDSDDDSDAADSTPAEVEEREVRVSLHLNSAMALLKLEDWDAALQATAAALRVQPENVKALYRRGVAQSRLGVLDGAAANLQKALKLEPTNREAKRELARLQERLKKRRSDEKKRMSGGLKGFSLYDDKEREAARKKKAEEAREAKRRKKHAEVNEERKAAGREEISFKDWEKEEKDKAEKAEKAAEEARKKAQRARDERRHRERLEEGSHRVVVDDDADLGNCRGYKTLADGRKTSYFTNVPDQATSELLAKQQAPRKLTDSPGTVERAEGSAWNAAGTTFEERDMKAWVDGALKKHLERAACALPASPALGSPGVSFHCSSVKNVKGEASVVVSRGRTRHIFEYSADVAFEASFLAEAPPGPGAATVKGTLHCPELSSTVNGAYECSVTRKSSSPVLSRPREEAFSRGVAEFKKATWAAMAAFVAE
eukprot:CAMPEP_0119272350 /NCGR_PEP_ID=MMETSP1329-20130426/8563_1 /TAXON_ID=114041 /ORGANISM="Genus nov. species nov., Strain RCC1024" /LENGTH=517 /DNA_ID=CAMNT_0007272413 /DNA_START=115 /DNA_END=1665 /DNA_ORIENTATION=-